MAIILIVFYAKWDIFAARQPICPLQDWEEGQGGEMASPLGDERQSAGWAMHRKKMRGDPP
ncbi:hypothetical protein [Bittarella massiliensis (ex Durand et al. 2017)]|uniref:Uncharacterized protein n=1 Tax=Bittarella massiliensis (ex Durand et al. 2017) TaxID=1720313 RepID=A0AAW5KIL3_9FIRM|nr:hypothetical protein [Bittarella massiliensis (ex Durand et al. 2017)]MCQ4950544.1 hypothetical protein [Bittarella massiliensis (ex Durand et al. 2017)]